MNSEILKNKKVIFLFILISLIIFPFLLIKPEGGGLEVREISPSLREYGVYVN